MSNKICQELTFQQEVSQQWDRLYAQALNLTKNPYDAEDLVQETLERALKNEDLFQKGTYLKAWMNTILYRTFCSRYRKLQKSRRRLNTLASMYQLRYDLANEIYIKSLNDIEDFILKTLKEELSPEYFEVLLAVDSLDLSYKETSTMLDLPMGTVMSRVHRARKVARSVLKSRELTLKSLNL